MFDLLYKGKMPITNSIKNNFQLIESLVFALIKIKNTYAAQYIF